MLLLFIGPSFQGGVCREARFLPLSAALLAIMRVSRFCNFSVPCSLGPNPPPLPPPHTRILITTRAVFLRSFALPV